MNGSLLKPRIGERRWTRGPRRLRRRPVSQPSAEARLDLAAGISAEVAARTEPAAKMPEGIALAPSGRVGFSSARVREASGPTDRASYACQCGYLFAAAVTTTVRCPHCGVAQVW